MCRRISRINNKGFTLFEMVICLCILSTLCFVSYPKIDRTLDGLSLNQALATFRSDVSLIRLHNMKPTSSFLQLKIFPCETYYEVQKTIGGDVLFARELPSGIQFETSEQSHLINFNSSGNILNAHTLNISSRHFEKAIVFSIGSGGMDIRDR